MKQNNVTDIYSDIIIFPYSIVLTNKCREIYSVQHIEVAGSEVHGLIASTRN